MNNKIFLFVVSVFLISCDPVDMRLKVINESENEIYVELLGDTLETKKWIDESIINYFYGESAQYEMKNHYAAKGDTIYLPTKGSYDKYFNSENGQLYIYVFDTLRLYEYSNGKISFEKCFHRYDFNKDKIESINWTLVHQ